LQLRVGLKHSASAFEELEVFDIAAAAVILAVESLRLARAGVGPH
jgi:hypothetical protein